MVNTNFVREGFKFHIVINHHGELLAFCLTSGNVDDRNMAVLSMLTKEIFGKVYADRLILQKRIIIECVINFLKFSQIEHTRHRSVANFIVNVVATLVAYSFILNKPRIVFFNDSSIMPIFPA